MTLPSVFTQADQKVNATDTLRKKTRPAYLSISAGVQMATFRDFATSPLFYDGRPTFVSLSHIDIDNQRESSFRILYSFGTYTSRLAEDRRGSSVKTFALNYIELFSVYERADSRLNVKIGGQLNSTAHIRDNKAFGNNSDGFEVISTLFGSAKGTLQLGSKGNFISNSLAFGLHVGLLNTSYRNGFIYTRQSPLLNQDNINDGYEFQLFSGYRINTSLDYIIRLKNRNAIQLSYLWDAFRTGGDYDAFEFSMHQLKLSLFYRLN